MGSGRLRKRTLLALGVFLSFFILTLGLAFGAGTVFAEDTNPPNVQPSNTGYSYSTPTSTYQFEVFAYDDLDDPGSGAITVEYQLNGTGSWTPCDITDGPDEDEGEMVTRAICTATDLSPGFTTISARATDDFDNTTDSENYLEEGVEYTLPVDGEVAVMYLDDKFDVYDDLDYQSFPIDVGIGDVTNVASDENGGLSFTNNAYFEFRDLNDVLNFDGVEKRFFTTVYVKDSDFAQESDRVVVGKANSAGDDWTWMLGVDGDGGVMCSITTSGGVQSVETSSDGTPEYLTDDAWNLIGCGYDPVSGELTAYINGVAEATTTVTEGSREIQASTGSFFVNGNSTIDAQFNGEMDSILITEGEAGSGVFGEPTVSQDAVLDIATKSLSSRYLAHMSAEAAGGLTLTNVEYQIGSDGWNDCAAVDAVFDEQSEDVECDVTGLTADEAETVYFRATDSNDLVTSSDSYLEMPLTYVSSPAGNLIAHFPFDNASGSDTNTLEDVTGFISFPDPTFNNPADISNDTTSGHNGANFVSGARIHYPDSNEVLSFGGPNARFKTEAHVKAADFGAVGYARVLSKTLSGTNDESWVMGIDNMGGIYCAIFTDNQYLIETGHSGAEGQLVDGAWNKIACSYDSTNGVMKAYLNDAVFSSIVVPESGRELAVSGNYFSVNSVDGGSPMNGSIDELKVYTYSEPIDPLPVVSMFSDVRYRTTFGDYELRGLVTSGDDITSVQYRGHDTEIGPEDFWNECEADDGDFDEISETFTCTVAAVADGRVTYDVRATNAAFDKSDVFVTDAFLEGGENFAYWWDFENVTDAGYHSGVGMGLGGASSSGGPSLADEEYEEGAIAFTGSERFAFTDPSATLAASTSGLLTMKFRIKPSASGLDNYHAVLQKMVGAGSTAWDVLIDPVGNIISRVTIPGQDSLQIGEGDERTLLDMDEWNDVEIAWDFENRVSRIKVNDNAVVNTAWVRPEFPQSAAGDLYIGNSENNDAGFIGEIDDLIIYKDTDATPPVISIEPLEHSDRVTTPNPVFVINITDDTSIASAEYMFPGVDEDSGDNDLDGFVWNAIAEPEDGTWDGTSEDVVITAPDFADGRQDLYIRAVDSNGNKSIYQRGTFGSTQHFQHYFLTSAYIMPFYHFVMETHDTTAPYIYANAVVPDPTVDRMPAVRGYVKDYLVLDSGDTISNIASIQYKIDGGSFTEVEALDDSYNSSREDFYIQIPTALTDGEHTVTIRAVDSEGNTTSTGTVNQPLGDVEITFTVTSSGVETDPEDIVRDIEFSSHEFQDEIFSDAVWGNDIVRLRQSIEFTSAPDYTPEGHDEYGWTYGSTNITAYPAADGNIWVATNNGALVYYNTDTQTATSYPILKDIGMQASLKEFEHDGDTYLFISFNGGGTSIIYDINNTPEDIEDDPEFADLIDNSDINAVNLVTAAGGIDTRDAGLAIWGAVDAGIVRLDLNNTPMDVSDDTYTLWGEAMDVGVNESDVYVGGFTGMYFDQEENLFLANSYGLGLFICSDNGTPTNQGDDECSGPSTHIETRNIFSVIKDPNGWYWEAGDRGVVRFNINGTIDQADDTFDFLITRASIGNESIAQIWWVEGEYPVGDEVWFVTRNGRLRGIEYNSTYDDNTDDTRYSYKLPTFEYQQGGGMSFVVTDKNTMWTPVAGQGLVKIELARDYEETNVVEIYPTPPAGLLEVDHVLLSEVVGSVSEDSEFTLDELTTFEVSNDAGVTWSDIEIGGTIDFSNSDYKLKLRITLHRGSTPILSSLSLAYVALPGDIIDVGGEDGGDGGGSSGSSGGSSSSGDATPGVCTAEPPGSKPPYLYAAVPLDDSSILLYFTDADDPMDRYILQYGTRSGISEYGAQYIGGKGTRTYKVSNLAPNTTYYFSIRAGNGCAVGGWSNETSATTRRFTSASLVENLVTKVKANVTDDVETAVPTWSTEEAVREQERAVGATTRQEDTPGVVAGFNFDSLMQLPWLWIGTGLLGLLMLLWLLSARKKRKKSKAQLPFTNTQLPETPQYFKTN